MSHWHFGCHSWLTLEVQWHHLSSSYQFLSEFNSLMLKHKLHLPLVRGQLHSNVQTNTLRHNDRTVSLFNRALSKVMVLLSIHIPANVFSRFLACFTFW
jgi:hypothetical protein